MIKRYRRTGGAIYLPTHVASNTLTLETGSTKSYSTVVNGEPGAVVSFKVTIYIHSFGGASYTVDSVTKVLNDTFTRTLDGSGNVTIAQVIDVGTTTPGNAINVVLTITGTTIGSVGSPDNTNISKTT